MLKVIVLLQITSNFRKALNFFTGGATGNWWHRSYVLQLVHIEFILNHPSRNAFLIIVLEIVQPAAGILVCIPLGFAMTFQGHLLSQ